MFALIHAPQSKKGEHKVRPYGETKQFGFFDTRIVVAGMARSYQPTTAFYA